MDRSSHVARADVSHFPVLPYTRCGSLPEIRCGSLPFRSCATQGDRAHARVGVFPAPKGGCWRGCWSGLGARRGPCALRAVVFIHSQTTPSLISQALSRRVWLPPAARRTPMRSRRGAGGGVELGCSGSWGLNGARLRSVLPWLHVGATWGDVGDPGNAVSLLQSVGHLGQAEVTHSMYSVL
jgi:hypothetical protein